MNGCVVRLEPGTTKNDEGRTFPFGTHPWLGALLVAQMERTLALQKKREESSDTSSTATEHRWATSGRRGKTPATWLVALAGSSTTCVGRP